MICRIWHGRTPRSVSDDYARFLSLLRLAPGAVVVADNILSHGIADYVAAVRGRPGAESVTLPIGKGLEVTRLP